ncbi:unnamed protein product [Strongylus vulgaris]|uniref:Uncharacterized protein n=1 Tax=Strongylus vulgaris TaxID=40348 RepID=A0A3P7L4T4_STRVU|nr:unnamed protein product [Strongylus vulgaris]
MAGPLVRLRQITMVIEANSRGFTTTKREQVAKSDSCASQKETVDGPVIEASDYIRRDRDGSFDNENTTLSFETENHEKPRTAEFGSPLSAAISTEENEPKLTGKYCKGKKMSKEAIENHGCVPPKRRCLAGLEEGSSEAGNNLKTGEAFGETDGEFTYATPDYEWIDEFEENVPRTNAKHTTTPKWNELVKEIAPRFSPMAFASSSSIAQGCALRYNEAGLRPMNPDYDRLAFDISDEDEGHEGQTENQTENQMGEIPTKKTCKSYQKGKEEKSKEGKALIPLFLGRFVD